MLRQNVGAGMPFVTFDVTATRELVIDDPEGFVRIQDQTIISEVQRVSRILLPLKRSVDESST